MSLFAVLVAVNELSNENFVIILEFLKFNTYNKSYSNGELIMKYISTAKYIECFIDRWNLILRIV